MIAGIVTWLLVALACYLLLRRVSYNLLDPIVVLSFYIPFAAAFLAVLCDTGLVTWDKFQLFCIVLVSYLVGIRAVSAFFKRDQFRSFMVDTLISIRGGEIAVVVVVTAAATIVLAALALGMGAQGDARQEFGRALRPLVLIQGGLSQLSSLLLASPRLAVSKSAPALLALALLSVPFSGKSVLLPVLFWYGLRLFMTGRRVSLKTLLLMTVTTVIGVVAMAMFAYGISSIGDAIVLFGARLWMSGDTYIYAYQEGALEELRSDYDVSFIPYMLHPLTSLLGLRAYDKPLGAMLASQVTGEDTLRGPNPHLPVVLDYFFPDQLIASVLLAFTIGALVMAVRPLCRVLASSRSRYVKLGGLVAAVFCPAMGFLDTSQVLIGLVAVAAATTVGATLELMLDRSQPVTTLEQGQRSST